MKKSCPLIFAFLLFFPVGRAVSQTSSFTGVDERELWVFSHVDSLILRGSFYQARDELLQLLRSNAAPEDQVLFRLVGIHHGAAVEDSGIELLDSLEESGFGNMYGWKVSLLDLARRPEDALLFVPEDRILLRCWLLHELESEIDEVIIPVPASLPERFVRVMLTPQGMLTSQQLEVIADDSAVLRSLRVRILEELALNLTKAGPYWEGIINRVSGFADEDSINLLTARRLSFLGTPSEEKWLQLLQCEQPIAVEAAESLLSLNVQKFACLWRIVDALAAGNRMNLVDDILYRSSDSIFIYGVQMTILYEEDRFEELLLLSERTAAGNNHPDSLLARAVLFKARALRGLRRSEEAYQAYLDFGNRFPWHGTAREAAYLAAKYFDSEQNWTLASDAYLASLRCSGTWEGDERAHWRGGFCSYMCGRGNTADSLWNAGPVIFPGGFWEDEMMFWRARLAERRGNGLLSSDLLNQVIEKHPWEYYGFLAARRLEVTSPIVQSAPMISPGHGTVLDMAIKATGTGYGVIASEMLAGSVDPEMGERSFYLILLGEFRPALSLMRRFDMHLRDSTGDILPDSLIPVYFPSPYIDIVRSTARNLLVPDMFLLGIIREESYFNRWVVSWAGARGLIQLMPGTASDVARWYGLPVLEEEQFFIPEFSIHYGSLYINRQYESFGGEQPLFLAAYNAGPGNASRWIEGHGWNPTDPELFIEQITYRETRIYIKKVTRSSWIYERMLNL